MYCLYLVASDAASWHAQQRVTRFRELHNSIQPRLGLAAAFPVPKQLFHSEAVKQEPGHAGGASEALHYRR